MEAINTVRKLFHSVTFNTAHAGLGVACNAYADAAAKSALSAVARSPVVTMVAVDINSRYTVLGRARAQG